MEELENENWELFCWEYLKHLNASRAYRAAYPNSSIRAAGTSAHELLKKPEISARIEQLKEERALRLQYGADQVVMDLIEIKERCMQASPVMEYDKVEKEWVETGEWSFKEAGAIKALELLGKHAGMWPQKKISDEIKEGIEDLVARLDGLDTEENGYG